MERDDVIDKLAKLEALANDVRAPQGERDAAAHRAEQLRDKYHVTAEDFHDIRNLYAGPQTETGFYSAMEGHLATIGIEISRALTRIDRLGPRYRVQEMHDFYGALRARIDLRAARHNHRIITVQQRRDAAVVDYYRICKTFYQWEGSGQNEEKSESQRLNIERHAHQMAVAEIRHSTSWRTPLTTSQVESIVGIKAKDLWDAYVKAYREENRPKAEMEGPPSDNNSEEVS